MPWLHIVIRLRYDYDPSPTTTYRARLLPFDAIQREQKMNMSIFRHSRIVLVSQSKRNCDIGFSKRKEAGDRERTAAYRHWVKSEDRWSDMELTSFCTYFDSR